MQRLPKVNIVKEKYGREPSIKYLNHTNNHKKHRKKPKKLAQENNIIHNRNLIISSNIEIEH
ncbi:MAG: hypothetical protein ACP5GU_04185 [Thermoprotei archaeon]|jgi:hypothetical protein